MPEYKLDIPKKKHALIRLNTYPKKNPYQTFDDEIEKTTPNTLFTPISRVCRVNLMRKIVENTVTEVETSHAAPPVPWLRKFVFEPKSKDENIRIKEAEQIKKPVDYDRLFRESFISVEEDIGEDVTVYDLVPGTDQPVILDTDERNFRIKEMGEYVMGYPSRVVMDRDGSVKEYRCNANSMSDYVLVEVKDGKAYYYVLKNSLRIRPMQKQAVDDEKLDIQG